MQWQLQQGVGTLAYPFYTGLSGNPKPTPVSRSATAYELDTRRRYVWRENQWWLFEEIAPPIAAATLDALERIAELLADIRLEAMATRLATQERLNEGNAIQHDFRELAQTSIDQSETEEP